MNMKRVFALVLAFGLMLCLCACTTEEPKEAEPTTKSTEAANKETDPTTEPTSDSAEDPTYVVTVVDENDEPVVGAWVQLCLESCVPAMTDENGVANFYLEENNYKVGFTVMPAGYEYVDEQQEWYFAEGENTMTVVIKKAE